MLHKNLTAYFKTNLKFKELCIDMLSRQYAFTSKQITTYKKIINFNESYLPRNKKIIWDIETIDEVKDKIDWSGFYHIQGVELNSKFFEKFENYIDFGSIGLNQNIDWSNELLDKYAELWDWDRLMMRPITATPRNIAKYNNRYDWDSFSSNWHLVLTEELIETYKDNWNWVKLSRNSNLKLNKKGIEKYKEKLCFNGLSRNAAMVPFILAYPNDYDWNWNAFIQNPGVVFSYKMIEFLIKKLKTELTILKKAKEEVQTNFAKSSIINSVTSSINFDRDFWFNDSFQNNINWNMLVKKIPKIFTSNEIETYLNLDDFEEHIIFSLMQKFSKEYILKNKDALLKSRWSLFRYGAIDQEFVKLNSIDSDWFQLAFNEQFNWSLEFLITHLDKFESLYGLSRNETIFKTLFGEATNDDIENLIKAY